MPLSVGRGSWVPIKHNVAWAEAYLRTKWHLDPSNRLATIHQRYRQTDRQTRQRYDSIGRTVSQTVAHLSNVTVELSFAHEIKRRHYIRLPTSLRKMTAPVRIIFDTLPCRVVLNMHVTSLSSQWRHLVLPLLKTKSVFLKRSCFLTSVPTL